MMWISGAYVYRDSDKSLWLNKIKIMIDKEAESMASIIGNYEGWCRYIGDNETEEPMWMTEPHQDKLVNVPRRERF